MREISLRPQEFVEGWTADLRVRAGKVGSRLVASEGPTYGRERDQSRRRLPFLGADQRYRLGETDTLRSCSIEGSLIARAWSQAWNDIPLGTNASGPRVTVRATAAIKV